MGVDRFAAGWVRDNFFHDRSHSSLSRSTISTFSRGEGGSGTRGEKPVNHAKPGQAEACPRTAAIAVLLHEIRSGFSHPATRLRRPENVIPERFPRQQRYFSSPRRIIPKQANPEVFRFKFRNVVQPHGIGYRPNEQPPDNERRKPKAIFKPRGTVKKTIIVILVRQFPEPLPNPGQLDNLRVRQQSQSWPASASLGSKVPSLSIHLRKQAQRGRLRGHYNLPSSIKVPPVTIPAQPARVHQNEICKRRFR